MKRIGVLAGICVALIAVYLIARSYSQPSAFQAPADFHVSEWKTDAIDHIRLAFAGGKEIDLKKTDGTWRVNGQPAEQTRIDQVLEYLGKAQITSRVSSNPDNHGSFDVGAEKGLTMTLFNGENEIQQVILGKTAGGETVYARLPDHDEVYVLSGLSRYYLSDEENVWRDRKIASFSKDNVRQVEYTENQIYWKLQQSKDGWTLANKWIAPVAVNADKVGEFMQSVANLQATDFATAEDTQKALEKKATFARAVIEIGTPDTFERRETWSIYTDQNDRYLIVRDSDKLGFYAPQATVDDLLSDYAATKARLTPSPDETKADVPSPAPDAK